MRRLVDVDELIKYFAEDLEGCDNREYILQMLDTKGRIARVKAIPIEYIQKWNNNYIADTMRNGRTIINQMLEDWEKENEQV